MVAWEKGRAGCCFVFLIALLLPPGLVNMSETPYWNCLGGSNMENSTFSHNLQLALAFVVANVSVTGFYNVTVGNSPDEALATAQCQGDLDGEACQVCVSYVASQVALRCPKNRVALIVIYGCVIYVREANFSVPQSLMKVSFPNAQVIPDPHRFKPMLTSFTNKLITSALSNPSGRLYWGDNKYTHNLTIYAMVQCLQNLSPNRCRSCLDGALALTLKDVAFSTGASVVYDIECLVSYDIFPFFAPLPQEIAATIGSAISISTSCSPPASDNKVGSPFHRNLKALLNHLTVHAPSSGFYNDTVGMGSNQVYGQAFCRGDVLRDDCWYCVGQASTKIQELCPNSIRAIIWLDRCQLRYSDENFAGTVDVYDRACQPAMENASKPVSFYQNLRVLIGDLTSAAMQSSPTRFFATGMSLLPDSSKRIYALVQCAIDIPADKCKWCLQDASSDVEVCSNGKQGGRVVRGSCILAFGVKPFFSGDPTLVSLPQPIHGKKRWWIFVIISVTGGLLLAAVCALCLVRRRMQHLEKLKQKEAIDAESVIENEVADHNLPQISLRTIEDATENFSKSNKLGEGGYGPVYKGKLPDGQGVAAKRLSGRSRQGLKEFKNEVELIVKLQHINLVRLIGCCLEKGEKILIYEYMPNKSLDFFLKDTESRVLLDWEKRFNIIIGIARGMLYLHQDSRLNVIHRDLKASNVLLDEQLNPKISDFGLARIFSGVQGQTTTSVIVGTYGYMAPEYAMDGVFSTKSDVYSFGILLLEIISGQLNAATNSVTLQGRSLVEHAWSLWCEGKGPEFIDPVVKDAATSTTSDQMLRCLHIGFLCIQEDAATRPTMSTVVLMLGNNLLDLPLPKEPAFIGENTTEQNQAYDVLM